MKNMMSVVISYVLIFGCGSTAISSASGSFGCPSAYDGTYIGQFTYQIENTNDTPFTWGTPIAFNITVTMSCVAVADGLALLSITAVTGGDAAFGCQLGCTGNLGVATIQASPGTTPSNPDPVGAGIVFDFPNGSSLSTSSGAGDMNVTTTETLSNSLTAPKNDTWNAVTSVGLNFPYTTNQGQWVPNYISWNLTKQGGVVATLTKLTNHGDMAVTLTKSGQLAYSYNGVSANARLAFYSCNGKLAVDAAVKGSSGTIHLPTLARGVYFVTLATDNLVKASTMMVVR
jgi:hypothetical protein